MNTTNTFNNNNNNNSNINIDNSKNVNNDRNSFNNNMAFPNAHDGHFITIPISTPHLVKLILKQEEAFEATGYAFSTSKKWWILSVVALCQTSMNYNAAVYSNAVEPLNRHYGISNARHGMVAFLVTYAFGCEIWAPWSEEVGRWKIMQLSLFFVNTFQLLCGGSTNWNMVLAGRVMGGLSSAGGSVLGGICGGPIEQYLTWEWNFVIQLAFGVIVQIIHFFCVPETRSTLLLDKEAKKRRESGKDTSIYGPNEIKPFGERFA
ncbi:MFS general substrate transporter [Amniculicola lignicola CBS 123094]|uniref:MFS general substrate transporter n=1 Tax=Amniculicola lignicola CBS 123094 TaxID=1392246 RepID=A0A6A5X028_9PLEO|nr:MFS general substrate transporter [Amniculicola lignicola CBS 123094]